MPSSDGYPEYDANLLSSAPAPTKGMVQSGYATELLEDKLQPTRPDDLEPGRHKSLSSKHTYVPNRKSFTDGQEQIGVIRTKPSPSTEKTPFYRTKKGIIILAIVAIVLLAAIIGGAVGGALANKKDSEKLKKAGTNSTNGDLSSTTLGDSGTPQGSPQGNVTDGTPPRRTTTVTITPSPSTSLSPAPPPPDTPLPISFTISIRQ